MLPEFREYERTLTACMNSYVRPKVATYVEQLQSELGGIGAKAEVNILRSDAGLMTTKEAMRNPIYGILSGPSGGVAGALYVARKAGFDDILTFDMGGTSTDVALCQNGQPTIGRETSISHFRIKVPSVNVHTVGAGGGSIAHVPELTKALRVGPQSAGAEPGPAAYGKGGAEPTVTDANVVLGHLPPRLLGGEMELDVEAARAAVAEGRRRRWGCPPSRPRRRGSWRSSTRTWRARCASSPCSAATTRASSRSSPTAVRGRSTRTPSPRSWARSPCSCRPHPGLLCAIGDLVADFRDEFAQTYIRVLSDADAGEVAAILESLGARATEWLEGEGIHPDARGISYSADMRYHRQGYEIPVAIDPAEVRDGGLADLEERFNGLHEQLYGFRMPGTAAEIVNLRAVGFGAVPKPELPTGELGPADASGAVADEHETVFEGESAGDEDLRPGTARARDALRGAGDRDRVRLDHGRPAGVHGAGRRELQHPHQPDGLRGGR